MTFGSNAAGQITSATDVSGTITVLYDQGDVSGIVDGAGHTTHLLTDSAGRPLTQTDPLGHVTRFDHNLFNQVRQIIDAQNGATTLTYDANGNLRTVTDARNGVTEYTYDVMDRVETRTDPLLKIERFIYDRSGNLFQHVDRRGQASTYRYDGLNRLTSATYADGSTTTYTYDAGDRLRQVVDALSGTTLDYTTLDYDDLDRLTSETTPRGTVTYGYDDGGRRTSLTVAGQAAVSYGYDDANRLTTITQGTSVVGFEYDTANRRTAVTLPNGVRVEYGYTATSQIAGLTYKLGPTVLGTLTYGYDAAGRRTELSGTWARTALPAALTSATYDAANRLTAWNGATLTYDDNGNVLTEGSRSYSWDARNRLSALGGLQPASFQYDAFGRRISKAVPSGTTDYLYDGAEAVQELAGGTPSANLLYGPGIDELLLRSSGATARWLVADGLGSALALLDPAGAVQTQYTYGAFGATSATGEASANAAQYTGRENDGTGLYYYRARYYSPRLQRFVSEDPIGFYGGDLNVYAYVGSSPTNLTDPSGLFVDTIVDVGSILYDIYRLANDGRKDRAGNLTALGADVIGAVVPGLTGLGQASRASKPSISAIKRALREVHEKVGKLPKGARGEWGSPQRGNPRKGYRLDPPHPPREGRDPAESCWHINYWDYTAGKRHTGLAVKGAVRIE